MTSKRYSENFDAVTQDELKKYRALMQEAKVEIDNEALIVIANLLRLNVQPEDIFAIVRDVAPVCNLLKRFKLKPHRSNLELNR